MRYVPPGRASLSSDAPGCVACVVTVFPSLLTSDPSLLRPGLAWPGGRYIYIYIIRSRPTRPTDRRRLKPIYNIYYLLTTPQLNHLSCVFFLLLSAFSGGRRRRRGRRMEEEGEKEERRGMMAITDPPAGNAVDLAPSPGGVVVVVVGRRRRNYRKSSAQGAAPAAAPPPPPPPPPLPRRMNVSRVPYAWEPDAFPSNRDTSHP